MLRLIQIVRALDISKDLDIFFRALDTCKDLDILSERERSGSVVVCLTQDRAAAGWSLTGVTALWSLSKTHLS